MAYDRKKPVHGRDHLKRFELYYQSFQKVAKRNGLRPKEVIRLCFLYLKESGHEIGPQYNKGTSNRLDGLMTTKDGRAELTAEGWRIVLQVIYSLKNTLDLKRTRTRGGIK